MNCINRISVIVLGIIFLMSVTGIAIYQAHCSCTGNEHVSLYISPETCAEKFHTHHIHLQGGEEVPAESSDCHECEHHTKDCGCDDTTLNFLKIDNEVVPEKVRTAAKQPVQTLRPQLMVVTLSVILTNPPETDYVFIDPPANKTSLDFLITIHQLKIPLVA